MATHAQRAASRGRQKRRAAEVEGGGGLIIGLAGHGGKKTKVRGDRVEWSALESAS